MKEFYKRNKKIIIGALIVKGFAVICGICIFLWNVYIVVSQTVPELQGSIKTLADTVILLDKSPIQINNRIGKIETKQEDMCEDLKEMKQMQRTQEEKRQEDFRTIILLLNDIKKNGD